MTNATKHTPVYSPPHRSATPAITVRRQGRQWAVHMDGRLIEGGFFSRDAAHAAAAALHADEYARATGEQS